MADLSAELIERVLGRGDAGGDPFEALVVADAAVDRGDLPLAASALDRAFGLSPGDAAVMKRRGEVLEQLTVIDHGFVFRYVPAGTFLMGSLGGDADERPVHAVRLGAYWLSDVPVSWTAYCELMGWSAPPRSEPPPGAPGTGENMALFALHQRNKIRRQYCETETTQATDWHGHDAGGLGPFRRPPRRAPERPFTWDAKPLVAVSWQEAEALARTLSTSDVEYALPSEAEWERAARGGLIGKTWSWGDAPPEPSRCDFGHFGTFSIRPPRELPPNAYGLHGMCGGVWEWTADVYDALAYQSERPPLPASAEVERALRGGSFTDCAEAVTVSFRMALSSNDWQDRSEAHRGVDSPNVGFRLCRRVRRGEDVSRR